MNLEDLVSQAQQVCEKRGARLTRARAEVLKLLAQHDGAVGAYDLLAQLQKTDESAKPATIYRALDFFEQTRFCSQN